MAAPATSLCLSSLRLLPWRGGHGHGTRCEKWGAGTGHLGRESSSPPARLPHTPQHLQRWHPARPGQRHPRVASGHAARTPGKTRPRHEDRCAPQHPAPTRPACQHGPGPHGHTPAPATQREPLHVMGDGFWTQTVVAAQQGFYFFIFL